MIVNNDDLKFVHRVILVDTTVDRPLNPLLLVKTRDDDGNPRCKIRVNSYRTIERGKQISCQKEGRGDNAVEIEPAIELEVDHRLRTHEHNDESNNRKERRCNPQHIVTPLRGSIFCKTLFELHAVERSRFHVKTACDLGGEFLHLHLVPLGHRPRGDLEGQRHLPLKRWCRTPCDLIHAYENPRRGDVDGTPREKPAPRQANIDRIVNEIALPVLRVLLVAYIVIGVDRLRRATSAVVAAMSRRIRHMRKKTAILFLLIQDVLFIPRCLTGELF